MEQDSNRYLLPFDTIVSAVNGEEQAMNEVLQCYDHYITRLSMENGCMVEELRNRLRGKLLSAVLKFKIDGYQRWPYVWQEHSVGVFLLSIYSGTGRKETGVCCRNGNASGQYCKRWKHCYKEQ